MSSFSTFTFSLQSNLKFLCDHEPLNVPQIHISWQRYLQNLSKYIEVFYRPSPLDPVIAMKWNEGVIKFADMRGPTAAPSQPWKRKWFNEATVLIKALLSNFSQDLLIKNTLSFCLRIRDPFISPSHTHTFHHRCEFSLGVWEFPLCQCFCS